jgi:hypothetical protein
LTIPVRDEERGGGQPRGHARVVEELAAEFRGARCHRGRSHAPAVDELHRTCFGEKALRCGDIAIILRVLFDFLEDEAIGRYDPLGIVHDVLSSAASFDYLWPR